MPPDQIVEHIAALCEAEGYFDSAPAAVVSPAGLHRLAAEGAVETVPLELHHALPYVEVALDDTRGWFLVD